MSLTFTAPVVDVYETYDAVLTEMNSGLRHLVGMRHGLSRDDVRSVVAAVRAEGFFDEAGFQRLVLRRRAEGLAARPSLYFDPI